ncbi:MAG: N-acetyltransferase [Anaerolineales bacterium]|nr:N-acetyltransferase [Anaerolineales bacterium]
MEIQIKEITTTGQLKKFIRFPHSIPRTNDGWVPALDFDELNNLHWDKNPAFEHCQARYFMAYKEGKPVGRVAAIYNKLHSETWGQNFLRFGWIDFIDDPAVSKGLMDRVEGWAAELGCSAVHGPLGFTDLDREGLLVEGFEELATLATRHDPAYYVEHLESFGYGKDVDWYEHEVTLPDELDEKIIRVAELSKRRYNLHVLEAKNKKELLKYAPELFEVINETYSHLYGVVHLSEKQRDAYVKQYFGFVIPDLVPVVLDENGRMVAFTIAMPSLSRAIQKARGKLFPFGFVHLLSALNKFDRIDTYLGAVVPRLQGRGVNAIMMVSLFNACKKYGVKTVHANPQLESNQKVWEQWKYFDARQHKRRRVLVKHLGPKSS